jgi:hypothetical protein
MNTLDPGSSLLAGQELQSTNGSYKLAMQYDGNLVLYSGTTCHWDSSTNDLEPYARPVRAEMQADGNFVLKDTANTPVWESGTSDHPDSKLVLEDDRNLIIQGSDGNILWDSLTQVIGPSSAVGRPVSASKSEYVGNGRWIDTQAMMYSNGYLAVNSYTKNTQWTHGQRTRIVILCVNALGEVHWVSSVFACLAYCGKADPTCPSEGRNTFINKFDEPVGRLTEQLHIYHFEDVDPTPFRDQWVRNIRDAAAFGTAISEEIKPLLEKLTTGVGSVGPSMDLPKPELDAFSAFRYHGRAWTS